MGALFLHEDPSSQIGSSGAHLTLFTSSSGYQFISRKLLEKRGLYAKADTCKWVRWPAGLESHLYLFDTDHYLGNFVRLGVNDANTIVEVDELGEWLFSDKTRSAAIVEWPDDYEAISIYDVGNWRSELWDGWKESYPWWLTRRPYVTWVGLHPSGYVNYPERLFWVTCDVAAKEDDDLASFFFSGDDHAQFRFLFGLLPLNGGVKLQYWTAKIIGDENNYLKYGLDDFGYHVKWALERAFATSFAFDGIYGLYTVPGRLHPSCEAESGITGFDHKYDGMTIVSG